jgi:hypothetical protein
MKIAYSVHDIIFVAVADTLEQHEHVRFHVGLCQWWVGVSDHLSKI